MGVLDKAGVIDEGDATIIYELPLDYSILEETDYVYPARDAYFAYTTRGCVNKCAFCAVPRLEPSYRGFIELKENIQKTAQRFGERRDLLLLDNNVFASKDFDRIIDEIRECGFGKDNAFYTPPNELKIAMDNLKRGWNDRAYIKKAVGLFREILEKIDDIDCAVQFRSALEAAHCLNEWTAAKEAVLSLESIAVLACTTSASFPTLICATLKKTRGL